MTPGRAVLVLAFGNPARGDDGLGPALARIVEDAAAPGVTTLWAYQPSVEHAAEVAEHGVVVFADASRSARAPYEFRRLEPRSMTAFSTHVVEPEAVLALARDTLGWRGDAYLLALRGHEFEVFEESLTTLAAENLREGARCLVSGLRGGRLGALLTDPPTDHSDDGGEPCQTTTA